MGIFNKCRNHIKRDAQIIRDNDFISKNYQTMLDANNNYMYLGFIKHLINVDNEQIQDLMSSYRQLREDSYYLWREQWRICGYISMPVHFLKRYKTDGFLVLLRMNENTVQKFVPYNSMIKDKADLHRHILYALSQPNSREYSLISIKEVKDYECIC